MAPPSPAVMIPMHCHGKPDERPFMNPAVPLCTTIITVGLIARGSYLCSHRCDGVAVTFLVIGVLTALCVVLNLCYIGKRCFKATYEAS